MAVSILPTPQFLHAALPRPGPGRFAWHYEALISPWMRREETPRLLRRMRKALDFPRNIPADAAGANRPGPGPRPRWRGRARARGRVFMHAELGGNLLVKERWLGFRNGMAGSLEYASKEREARLLTKGEQLPCSGCVKAFPSFTPGQCQWAGEKGQVAE